jgi:hypothetical protein
VAWAVAGLEERDWDQGLVLAVWGQAWEGAVLVESVAAGSHSDVNSVSCMPSPIWGACGGLTYVVFLPTWTRVKRRAPVVVDGKTRWVRDRG